MEGIKRKILIVFLIAVALVLGYQACVMATGEGYTKPAGAAVPFTDPNTGLLVYCREHHNGWGYHGSVTSAEVHYKCVGEINTDKQEAYGFAYLLKKGSSYQIQSWIWAHSGSANGQYILNPSTDFSKYFTGYKGNDNTEQADGENLPEGAQEIVTVKLIECLNDPTINIVDQVPYLFFDKENENLIQDISYAEYNYLYQLQYLFGHMSNLSEQNRTVEKLKEHMKDYESDGIGSVYFERNDNDETGKKFADIVKDGIFEETKNKYGEEIDKYTCTLNDNREVVYWAYRNEKNEDGTYNKIYHIEKENNSGTSKYDKRVLFDENDEGKQNDILKKYINIFNSNNFSELKKLLEDKGYKNLADKLEKVDGDSIFAKLNNSYKNEHKRIVEIAENENTDLGENGTVNIEHDNDKQYFKFSGNVYQAAKIYQWLMNEGRLAKYADGFKVNTDSAKVSIDAENGKYIVGPFSMNYATVILNDDILLGLDSFEIKVNEKTLKEDEYKIIKSGDSKIPASGEEFYIELNKDVKGENDLLNKDDKVLFKANYKYVKSIYATVHFLQGVFDEDSWQTFNTNHPQRLMTHETTVDAGTIEKTGSVSPDYYDFVIEKFEKGTENKLQGAVFAALARYSPEYGSDIYLDLETQKSGFQVTEGDYNGGNGIFSALNNESVKGKYETDENGRITFANVPEKVTYNGTTYTLQSVVAKETKAPDGCILDDSHFEIKKDSNIATIRRDNIKQKPYEITVRKVNEKGEPIKGVTFEYWYLNLRENLFEASNSGHDVYHSKKAITDDNGIAKFESKVQGDLIALVACEVPDDTTKEYKYFRSILILYSTKTDSDGNVQIEFFDSETASDAAKELYKHNSYGLERDTKTVINGVHRITTKEGKKLFGKDANQYIKCGEQAGSNIDIQITNETIKPYNLELYKYDENGKQSTYLDDTEFEVTIAKQYQTVYKDKVVVKDGIAKIDDLKIYDENLYVYLKETPKQGFKTDLYNETDGKGRMVLIYSADESGKIKIKYKNESFLNPTLSKFEGYESAQVVEGENGNLISLRLGIINQPEDYVLKFKKVNEKGEPLQGATFGLYKDETCLGTDTTDENGYMTFKGLTLTSKDENDIITLTLKEISSKAGYEFSDSDVQLEYVYIPGSNVLKNIKITKLSDNSVLRQQAELQIEENENKEIIFNLRELNEIFELVNTPNPYDLELFTKVDENGKPIADIDFNVSIYSINEDGTKNFVDSKDGKVENRKVTSNKEDGKVIIEGIKDYGTYYVEVKETSESDKYETLTDILRFTYTINPGDTKVKWNTLEILDETGKVIKTYIRHTDNATKFQTEDQTGSYDNVKIDNDDLYLINPNKPYDLVINKVNGLTGKPMPEVEFSAIVLKNHTSEKQYFTGTTDKDGKIVLKGIKIYSTPQDVEENRERLTVIIDENVPEGYKWHDEYEEIRYTIDYKKFSTTEPIIRYGGSNGTIAGKKGTMYELIDDNANIKITESTNGAQSEIITIENMPVYDLPIFDKKVERIGDTENEIKGGITFTAKLVNGSGETLQENVKVTFDENGIIARDIDTCKEFMNADGTIKDKVEGLKLILTEVENNAYEKIDDITVVYNCTYNQETDKFETEITDFEYQGTSYKYENKKDLIDDLVYVVDGKAVLVNKPKSTELALRKVDENGNPISGVRFIGKVYKADDENQYQSFDVITDNGLAIIKNITLTGEVKVVIEEESWMDSDVKNRFNYNELEFMKNIEISGIVINVDGNGNRTVDYTNVVVDDTHKEQVKINKTTMEIEVTNKFLTYSIPIVKTTDLLSNNENAEKLPNVMFNVSIKNVGEGPAMTQVFNNVTTDSNGELVLSGISKFGDVVLTLEETVGAPNTKMLEHPVDIEYNAIIDENGEVKLTFKEDTYADGKIAYITDLEVLNVVNTRDYSITLHKKINVDGTSQEINDTEKVTFKGIVTTNKDIVVNINGEDKKVNELTYKEFIDNITKIQALDSENVKYFEGDTEKGLYEVPGLNFYNQTVYVYFIETNVPDSMTIIEEVIKVAFIQENAGTKIPDPIPDKVELNTENKLDIQLTVINDASSYKVNLIKVDEITGKNVELKNAKFRVVLKELNGESVVSSDEAIISFDSIGTIDESNSKLGNNYIVGMELVDGYIQLDVNKFGTLQLEITEETAPKHYIKYEGTMVVKYDAEPGNISVNEVIGPDKLTSEVKTDILSLDITIPNKPQSYDLPIKKVVKQTLDSEELTGANNVKFDVNFFNTNGERIMTDKTAIYNVQNGKFTINDIETFGEYYITLEEYDVPDDIVKLEEIHVFKIKATPEDKEDEKTGMVISEDVVKEITYEGTAKIENDKLTINNDKSAEKYFDLKDEDGDIARLEISNIPVKQYYLDLTKVATDENGNILKDDEENPITLSGAEFSLYLTNSDENYQTGENLLDKILDKTSGIKTNRDGKIAIGPLKHVGEYKLTVIEDLAPEKMKKTFDMIEIVYYTKDGENLEVRSVKVVGADGKEVTDTTKAIETGIGTNDGLASIEFTIKNIEKKPVPLSIHKIYYKDGSTQKLPVENAIFSGVVREVETKHEYTFSNIKTNANGEANLGSFYIDGKVEVEITEVVAPAGLDTIEPSTIYITVNNETQKVDENNYTCSSNALEGIKDNTFTIVDTQTYNPKITLAGLVWEDIKQNNKGEDTYTLEGYYTEGLYDAGYDKTIAGVVVRLYKQGWDHTPVATYTTKADGTYVFEDLNPFDKYYITFEYNGKDYEAVKYLVKDANNGQVQSYGSIADAINKANWDKNSKAVTNSDNENLATTTQTKEAISKDARGNIQYYPVYDKFTIDDEGVTLYIKDGSYTLDTNGNEAVDFKPLQPSHQHINFGIKERPTFDLRLSKDVEYIKVTLNNGTSMEYKYGIKPDSSMYKLEISEADIKNISNLEIVYKITVANEDLSDGKLNSISDYYDFDILEFSGWSKNRNEGYTTNATNNKKYEDFTKIIPKQTYESSSSKLSKDNKANTGYVIIDTKQDIKAGESADIYVKYEYTDKLIKELKGKSFGDEFVTLGVAEIRASESTTGRQDKDSDAGNLVSKFDQLNNFYEDNGEYSYYTKLNTNVKEDDEDAAPAAKIVVRDTPRSISGNVFEDLNKDGILTEGTANNDTLIKGITVELHDSKSNSKVAETTTNENGEYKFTGIPAGEYKVVFKYGDKNTVLPILKDSEGTVINSDTVNDYPRQNDKSYNALEFEATQSTENTGLYWYADSERKSDAKDTNPTRTNANNLLNETIAKSQDGTTYGIMNNKQAERLYSYRGDTNIQAVRDYIEELSNHYVIAETPNFKVNMENTADTEVQYESEAENGTVYYKGGIIANTSLANNIDFGIKERPQSDITVTKEVENVKIHGTNGRFVVDVSLDENGKPVGEASRVQWNKGENSGKGYIWIQRAEEEIVGATLEITYKITITNGAGEDITLRVADYVQDGMTYAEANNLDENKNAIWEIAKAQTEVEGKVIKSSKVGDVEINNTIDLRNVSTVLVKDIDLNEANGYKADINITLTKNLNAYSDTDIDAYTNYVEVIQTASKGLAKKDINSIPGNYDPVKQTTTEGNLGRTVTSLDVNGLEKDSSKALETISITAETGENRATYYILTFAVIAVFATGVVLIKKYAIKK